MAQALGMYQDMAEGVVASKDMGRLIYTRRELITQRRERYEDVSLRNSLYQLISLINRAISELNLETIDRHIAGARYYLTQANNLVTKPPININANDLASQVNTQTARAKASVDKLEQDRHLSPLMRHRQAVLTTLKTDIESLSRSILIVAAIEERQQLQRQQEAKRRQELEAAAKKLRQQQCVERLHQAEELKKLLSRFDSAINIHDVDQAQHVLWVLGQQNQDILSLALHDQAPDMALARMKQQVQSLRRDLFGHQGIQNLDAPTAALS